MHPDLFHFTIFGQVRTVHSYGVMLLLAGAVGTGLMMMLGRRRGLAAWDSASVALLGLGCGLLGAGLLDALVNWRQLLSEGYQPGLVFYGGVLGAGSGVLAFVRRFRLPLGELGDVGAVVIPVGHALGRLGCLLGGCCYGRPAGTWPGLIFKDPVAPATVLSRGELPLHPVQLYEAAGLLLIAAMTLGLFLRGRVRGRLILVYLAAYALLRLVTETLRGDRYRGHWGPLSTSQWIAVAVIALVSLLAMVGRRRRPV